MKEIVGDSLSGLLPPLVLWRSCPVSLLPEMQALTHLRTPASRTPGVLPDSALDLGTRLQPTFPTKGLDLFPAPGSQPETSVPVPGRCPDPVLHARAREASQIPGVLLRLPMRAAGVRSPWAGRPEAGRVQGEEREGWLGRGAGLLGLPARPASPSASSSSRARLGLGSFFGSVSIPQLGGRRTCLVLATDAGRFGTRPFASARQRVGCEVSTGDSGACPWGPRPHVRLRGSRLIPGALLSTPSQCQALVRH